jgi:hypothetical protein
MASSLSNIAAKDGAGATVAGGILAVDKSGAGTGPFVPAHAIVDTQGVNTATVKAASTAAGATDTALVVAISPNNTVPVSLTSTTITGTVAVTESGTWTVQPGNTPNTSPWLFKINDGTTTLPVLAGSSGAPAASSPALPVSIRDVNANISDGSGQTSSGHAGAPVVGIDPYSQYKTVAASQTSQVLGATGAQYDYLAGILIVPATSAAGAVSIADGNGSSITVFAGGGTTALSDLKPFLVPLGLHALAATTPGWKVTTGANVSAIGIGKFT